MAVECMQYVLGIMSNVPKPIKAFLKGSSQKNVAARPQHAWELLDEFNELIERMWGPRKFLPFTMNKGDT